MWNSFLYVCQMTLSIKFIIDDNSTFSFNHTRINTDMSRTMMAIFLFFPLLFCLFLFQCVHWILPLSNLFSLRSISASHTVVYWIDTMWPQMNAHATYRFLVYQCPLPSCFTMEYGIYIYMKQQNIVISMANTNWKSTPLNSVCFSYPFIKWLNIGSCSLAWM